MNKYLVTCKDCGSKDFVAIDRDDRIFWSHNKSIVSGRKRFDNEWGWQCVCGNTSILSDQEATVITNKQSPDPKEVSQVAENPKRDKVIKFEMEKQ